jgi:hypothetical protein
MGIDLRIFHILKDRSEVAPISANELAEIVGAETQFIGGKCFINLITRAKRYLVRIMRVITSIRYAQEAGERLYTSTPLTVAITVPALEACMIHRYANIHIDILYFYIYFNPHILRPKLNQF